MHIPRPCQGRSARARRLVLLASCALGLLLACAGRHEPARSAEPAAAPAPYAEASPSATPTSEATAQARESLPGLQRSLFESSWDLAARMHVPVKNELQAKGGNLCFSPTSVQLTMAMLYAGARGRTQAEIAEAMGFQDRPEAVFEAVHRAREAWTLHGLRRERARYSSPLAAAPAASQPAAARGARPPPSPPAAGQAHEREDRVIWSLAAALFPVEGLPLREEFVGLVRRGFETEVRAMPFGARPDESRQEINEWVSGKTYQRIPELLPPGAVHGGTRLVVVSALYLNVPWADPFTSSRPGPFRLPSGKTVQVQMMSRHGTLHHEQRGGVHAIELPYRHEDHSMILLLPPDGEPLEWLEQRLTARALLDWTSYLPLQKAELLMPKFSIGPGQELRLRPVLEALGMRSAFRGGDFSGITPGPLELEEVYHDALTQVDEWGTVAASATAVTMTIGARVIPKVVVDRPFLFLIRDNRVGQVLMLGRVVDPSSGVGG